MALLVVMYGESDQGLQVLRAAADVCVCVCLRADSCCRPREHI